MIGIGPLRGLSSGTTAQAFSESQNYRQIPTLVTFPPSENLHVQTWTPKTVDSSMDESSGFFRDLDSHWMLRRLIHFSSP